MPYRLIAIDIDGTLLTAQRTITPRTVRLIDEAVSAGVRVVLCTGRSLHSGRHVAEQVHLSTSLIFHSGALILERLDGPILRAINLTQNLARALIAFLKDEGYDPLVYDPVPESRYFLYEPPRTPNEWRRRYIEANDGKARPVPDLLSAMTHDPAQVAFAGLGVDMDRMQARIRAGWPEVGLIRSCSTLVRDYWIIEVVPHGVSKGGALAFLGEVYAIDPEDMIAVGDNFNDLDMIVYAGLGVAVGNAPEEVRAAADVVAPTNDEEGVAYVIEKYLLQRNPDPV